MSDHKLKSHSDKSIAVLPFVNMSKDPENEYFSDGITEEIINALTTIQGLKVIARTSSFAFKNKNIDIRIIGNQLGVSTILEGSVRKANNRVRITAQLIDTIDGTHLWSKNFDRELEDIFALQDEVSLLIADQIRENFGHFEIPPILQTVPTKNIEAYNLWLKGSYHLKRKDFDDIKKASTFFLEAIQLDPNYATAYSFLGEAYIHAAGFGMMSTKEAHELARTSVEKAIAIDIKQAQAYKVLAFIQLFYDWEWKSAIEAYDKAIAYGLPDQNEFISYYYIFIKEDFEKAIQVAQRATETDPLHVITHWQLGLTYYFARRFEASILAFSKALEIDPNFGEALRFRGLVKGCSGQYNEALIDIQKALAFSNGQGPANMDMLMVKILMGKKKEALSIIQKTDYIDSSDPASLYALLQMPDEAIHWLEKAYQERSVMLVTLKNFWFWDNIREDTRFQKIYQRMKFPESIKNKEQLESISIRPLAPTNSALLSEKEIDLHLEQLGRLISEEIYTDPSLSLRKLAERIDLHSNKLSWLINEHIGKNFNEYINAFRLQKFKENALNPRNSHLTLLALAYESGFNSKTAFNAFFKKMEGTTPRNWVKKHTQ
jgi:TolB-like protein/AraC-like DNA-binding protein/Tfp pilus assembly protein PilF